MASPERKISRDWAIASSSKTSRLSSERVQPVRASISEIVT